MKLEYPYRIIIVYYISIDITYSYRSITKFYWTRIAATALTFIRFVPKIKAKYDYGVLIFLLTFCLISVSGFQEEDVLKMTYNRVSTVFMGGAVCVVVSVGICPVWAGENLHNLIALNIQKLGSFLEGI